MAATMAFRAFSFLAISWFYCGIWVLSNLNLVDETFTQDVAFEHALSTKTVGQIYCSYVVLFNSIVFIQGTPWPIRPGRLQQFVGSVRPGAKGTPVG